jgi:hypothetical protein
MTTPPRCRERARIDSTAPQSEDGQEIGFGVDLGAQQFTSPDGPAPHQAQQVREFEDDAGPVHAGDQRRADGRPAGPDLQPLVPARHSLVPAGLGPGGFGIADHYLKGSEEDLRRLVPLSGTRRP